MSLLSINDPGLYHICKELKLHCSYDSFNHALHFVGTIRHRAGTNSLDDKQDFENTMLDLFGPEQELSVTISAKSIYDSDYYELRSLLIKKFFPTV